MSWRGESRRHSLARKGISTARGISTRGESTDSRLKAGFGLSKQQMEDIVRDYVQDTIMFNGMDALVVDVKLWGSYLKGKERGDSDLDFIVEYKGSEREDDMFNLLNDEENKMCFNGIEVDINPIKEEKSGTIEKYLKSSGGTASIEKQEVIEKITERVWKVREKRNNAIRQGKRSKAKVNIQRLSKDTGIPEGELNNIVGMATLSSLGGKDEVYDTVKSMLMGES